jgi:hypothetical protein
MMRIDIQKEIINHYKKNWFLEDAYFMTLDEGPMKSFNPQFSVLINPPTEKRAMWTYATVGMSDTKDNSMELHLFSKKENDGIIEILTAIAYYKLTENKIALDDTVNFGKPWFANSKCDHGLISLPYLDGANLETLTVENKTISFYWLIPITKQERDFRWKFGIDKLEDLFETKQFNYLNPLRKSLV